MNMTTIIIGAYVDEKRRECSGLGSRFTRTGWSTKLVWALTISYFMSMPTCSTVAHKGLLGASMCHLVKGGIGDEN